MAISGFEWNDKLLTRLRFQSYKLLPYDIKSGDDPDEAVEGNADISRDPNLDNTNELEHSSSDNIKIPTEDTVPSDAAGQSHPESRLESPSNDNQVPVENEVERLSESFDASELRKVRSHLEHSVKDCVQLLQVCMRYIFKCCGCHGVHTLFFLSIVGTRLIKEIPITSVREHTKDYLLLCVWYWHVQES